MLAEYEATPGAPALTREERFTPTPIYQREVEVMEGELRGERSLLPDAAQATYMIAMADAIFEAIKTRRIVPVTDPVATPSANRSR